MYRNDLDAAHARIAALEEELARERARDDPRITELESEIARLRAVGTPKSPPERAKPRKLGRSICYHPPRTYIPFLRLMLVAIPSGVRAIRALGAIESPDNVLAWLLMRAFVAVAWLVGLPIYYLVLWPWFAFLMIALTPLLVVIVALTRFRFSPVPPEDSGWFHGMYTGSTEEAAGIAGAVFTVTTSTGGLAVPLVMAIGAAF